MGKADGEVGAAIFEEHCQRCHGPNGAGDGPLSAALDPAPPDWTDAEAMEDETPFWFREAIAKGVLGSSMQRYDTLLGEQELWDAAWYAWSRPATTERLGLGAALYRESCASCHGADGGAEARARLDERGFVRRSRAEQAEVLRSVHPEEAASLGDSQLAALVEHLFTFLYRPGPEDRPH